MARAGEIEKANREKFKNYIASFRPKEKSFSETEVVSPDSLLTRIAIDEQKKRLCIWLPTDMNKPIREMTYDVFEYDFVDVTNVEMVINKQLIQNKEPEKISSLKLDISVPEKTHTLIFFDTRFQTGQSQLLRGTAQYQTYLKCFKDGFALVKKAIALAGEEQKGNEVKTIFAASSSDASNHEEKEEQEIQKTRKNGSEEEQRANKQDNIYHLEEDAFARFEQAFEKIRASKNLERSGDEPPSDHLHAVEHERDEDDLFASFSTQNKDKDTDVLPTNDVIHTESNEQKQSNLYFDHAPPSDPTEKEDSLTDFEKFLESNKQKQYGPSKKN